STNRFSQRHEPADAPLNEHAGLFKQTEPPLIAAIGAAHDRRQFSESIAAT
ncbi:hypothetical protein ACVWZA_004403, partial [Sphingomonas sp. UYAg733]